MQNPGGQSGQSTPENSAASAVQSALQSGAKAQDVSVALQEVLPAQQESQTQAQSQTQINVLTGLAAPEGMAFGQRPLAIVVGNGLRALPQRGLADADIVVEMLIDSVETRLLALYADYRTVPSVGPIHSTYDQFVQFALPIDAVQAHIDKTSYAANLLAVCGQKDLDGIYMGTTTFWFDVNRQLPRLTGKLNENCWYTDTGLLLNGMGIASINTVGKTANMFGFGTVGQFAQSLSAHYVQGVFSGQYVSGFNYVPEQDLYNKTAFSSPHIDEGGAQLAYTNVFFLSVDIAQKADSSFLEFDFSKGSGWYFTGGGMEEIYWQKGDVEEPFVFKTKTGQNLAVKPGKSYIGFVPNGQENAVTWQAALG